MLFDRVLHRLVRCVVESVAIVARPLRDVLFHFGPPEEQYGDGTVSVHGDTNFIDTHCCPCTSQFLFLVYSAI